MKNLKKPEILINNINAVQIPEKYDMQAWEIEAIRANANGDLFALITNAFSLGYLKGLKAGKDGK